MSDTLKLVELIDNGGEQSIHLPVDCRMEASQVFVKRLGRSILLIPKDEDPWDMMERSLDEFTDDFMAQPSELSEQTRGVAFE